MIMFRIFLPILLLLLVTIDAEQFSLGTHFYVNQDNVLVDNTLKSVSTLARPYDLVAFVRQSERLARVDRLQALIDAVEDVDEPTSSTKVNDEQSIGETTNNNNHHDNDKDECNEFIRDGESLIFKLLKTNLYEILQIPFELKNISKQYFNHTNENSKVKSIQTCTHFCRIDASLLTFDHLPSIASRSDRSQPIRIDDEVTVASQSEYNQQTALWASNELVHNRTSWLAYVLLARHFFSNSSYNHAIDCLRCALIHGQNHEDITLVELANIVYRYGYIRDAIVFIERALDRQLRTTTSNHSLFIRALLHYYLGNLCTIDNRFVLGVQFYNRTNRLLARIKKFGDDRQQQILSSSSLGPFALPSLSAMSQRKFDALRCHLTIELSLRRKQYMLKTKLAQLHQLRSITDELIQLNALIKRDMSNGQSFVESVRKARQEQIDLICDWDRIKTNPIHQGSTVRISTSKNYSIIMFEIIKRKQFCSIEDHEIVEIEKRMHDQIVQDFNCRPRYETSSNEYEIDPENKKQSAIASRLAAVKTSHSSYSPRDEIEPTKTMQYTAHSSTLTSTTTWPTLTSRLPTNVVVTKQKQFILKQADELYPSLVVEDPTTTINDQYHPTYADCQIHYRKLPSIGDYPTVWLPLENKGLLNIRRAFYEGLDHPHKHYPLPWSPPLCTLDVPIDEHSSIILRHPILARVSRMRAPQTRFDTNMLLNLYSYIDVSIDEQLPIEEFGQRLRSVGEHPDRFLPEWIVHLLSSLYWRINGHLPHALDCALKAHENLLKKSHTKQWSDVTLINLANILYLWGKYEDALDLTQQAYAINSHEPITNFFLGNLLALTKTNHTAAREYYHRTLNIDSTHIYARRQLRLSYCHSMHTDWERMRCTEHNDCRIDGETLDKSKSMKCDSMLLPYRHALSDATTPESGSVLPSHHNTRCRSSMLPGTGENRLDNRSSIDRWLNRSCLSSSSSKREFLLADARRAYRLYGLCSSSSATNNDNECSQGFAVTSQGTDIGHLTIVYDAVKQTYDYTFVFTTDYERLFGSEDRTKCLIYGTGRKSTGCRHLSSMMIDPNEINSKHKLTWWRDPSTLYEHLKELIEIMNTEHEQREISSQENGSVSIENNDPNENLFELQEHLSDAYLLSETTMEKYLFNNEMNDPEFDKDVNCTKKSPATFTSYLSTWISPQTKGVHFNQTFFKQLKKNNEEIIEPICPPFISLLEQNNSEHSRLFEYIFKIKKYDLTLFRTEPVLRPILLNLLFDKPPSVVNKGDDDKASVGSLLASGLLSPVYNTSWLFFHTLSLYWRLMGNASQALNCLAYSHFLSPTNVHDLTFVSMALIFYNSQLYTNEAIYLLYEALTIDRRALLLAHFTLANAMARKGHLDKAQQWYRSTLILKEDFEPARKRLRAIQCQSV